MGALRPHGVYLKRSGKFKRSHSSSDTGHQYVMDEPPIPLSSILEALIVN